MSVNKDFFEPEREFNYDFESAGKPAVGWKASARVPETLVPTHCCFCGVEERGASWSGSAGTRHWTTL
jgi:assimilatory nitrate reductase catalytic subunit